MMTVALELRVERDPPTWWPCDPEQADLLICDVPDGTDVDTVSRHANDTIINLPVNLPATPIISYDLIGRGLVVNLYKQ
jgi:hypothetical protein